MVHSALKGCHVLTVGGVSRNRPSWNNQSLKRWIEEASGEVESRLTQETTHFVCDRELFDARGTLVNQVIEAKESGHKVKLVNFGWLQESLEKKTRRSEKSHKLTVKIDNDDDEPRSVVGLMKQVFLESAPMTDYDQKRVEKEKQHQELMMQEAEAQNMKEFEKNTMGLAEQAAVFKRGAQKAKKFLLSNNHHIYQDHTGFYYDITLTKVDTKFNTNERYNLVFQIFESNSIPSTYAFNVAFSGTRLQSIHNTIVAIGSNWPTVFRVFKMSFKEKTGIEWDKRIEVAKERSTQEALQKLRAKHAKQARQRNQNVPTQLTTPPRTTISTATNANFQYNPPAYGPKGALEDGSHLKPAYHHLRGETETVGQSEIPEGEFKMSRGNVDAIFERPLEQHPSESPVKPDFEPKDVEKFHVALNASNLEDRLDPFSLPFSFGQDPDNSDFDEAIDDSRMDSNKTSNDDDRQSDHAISSEMAHGDSAGGSFAFELEISGLDAVQQASYSRTEAFPNSDGDIGVLGKRKENSGDGSLPRKQQKMDLSASGGDEVNFVQT